MSYNRERIIFNIGLAVVVTCCVLGIAFPVLNQVMGWILWVLGVSILLGVLISFAHDYYDYRKTSITGGLVMYLIPGTPQHALHLINIGQRSQMPGIARCTDCAEPFINDYSGIKHCPDCRPNHDRICTACGTHFDGEPNGHRLCKCCRQQEPLF